MKNSQKKLDIYFAFHLSENGDGPIGGHSDGTLPTYEDTSTIKKRIGAKIYNKINKAIKSPVPLSIDENWLIESDEDIMAAAKILFNTKSNRTISPRVSDYDCVQIFSNVDILQLLSDQFPDDVSGTYIAASGCFVLLKKVGCIDGINAKAFERVEPQHETQQEVTDAVFDTLKQLQSMLLNNAADLKLFMLSYEHTHRDHYHQESLPEAIDLSFKDNALTATVPCFMSYDEDVYEEPFMQAYYKARFFIALWFGIDADQVDIKVAFRRELVGFQVAPNVWIESVVGDKNPDSGPGSVDGNKYWWNSEHIRELQHQEHNAQTVAQWLMSEGATQVCFYSFLEHDAGDEVAYTISVFKGRTRVLYFSVSAFDPQAGRDWIGELEKALPIPLVHGGEKEDDWELVDLSDEGMWPHYIMPRAPESMEEIFSLIGIYFNAQGFPAADLPHMLSLTEFPELLSLGLNAPLPFEGYISSPSLVRTSDVLAPLYRCYETVKHAMEDGISISSASMAERIRFECTQMGAANSGVGVLSIILLRISDSTLFDYTSAGDFVTGPINKPSLLEKLNAKFPGMKATEVVMAPLLRMS